MGGYSINEINAKGACFQLFVEQDCCKYSLGWLQNLPKPALT